MFFLLPECPSIQQLQNNLAWMGNFWQSFFSVFGSNKWVRKEGMNYNMTNFYTPKSNQVNIEKKVYVNK